MFVKTLIVHILSEILLNLSWGGKSENSPLSVIRLFLSREGFHVDLYIEF